MSSDSNILRGVLDFFSSNTATHTISTSMANNESGEDDDDTEEDDVEYLPTSSYPRNWK